MNEIEVKAKIWDKEGVLENLKRLGCVLSAPIRQFDRIYSLGGRKLENIDNKTNVLRIREQAGKNFLTLKRNRSNELDCLEHEIEISNSDEAEKILHCLDYFEFVQVEKIRQKGRLNDLEICLDEVAGLGGFIEVEKMSDEDGAKIQQDLFDFLVSIGIAPEDRVRHGYDTLIMRKADQEIYGKSA